MPHTLDLTSLPTELLRLVEVISAQSEQVKVFEICSQVISTGKQNLIIVFENVRALCERSNSSRSVEKLNSYLYFK